MRVGIEGVSYSLTHVPDFVRYGSKPLREIRARPALGQQLAEHLRDFNAATAYAPHQVYIGNIAPEQLGDLAKPWYDKLIEGATAKGRFGDLVDQNQFYAQLGGADRFELVMLDERWFREHAAQYLIGRERRVWVRWRRSSRAAPKARWRSIPAIDWSARSSRDTRRMPISLPKSCWKISRRKSRPLIRCARCYMRLKMDRGEIDYVISCSEEAVGDRYNRGGGNLAKAIAEDVGCDNASGSDTKAFCAGPMYAMVHGGELDSVRSRQKGCGGGGRIARQARHEIRIAFEKEHANSRRRARQLCRDLGAGQARTAVHSTRLRRLSSRPRRLVASSNGGISCGKAVGQTGVEAYRCRPLRSRVAQSRDHCAFRQR